MLNQLYDCNIWENIFVNFKKNHPFQRNKIKDYNNIINTKKYIEITDKIISRNYLFSLPKKLEINKLDTDKKKTVFLFSAQDDFLLKVFSSLLTDSFSYLISPNCHSFQRNKGAKTAFKSILSDKNLNKKSVFKTDIKNFFNSINIEDFLSSLPTQISDNKDVMFVLRSVLLNNKVIYNNNIITVKKGLMAGSPIAPFLSNLYLYDIDQYFANQQITYARYSDDIIFFDYEQNIDQHIDFLEKKLNSKHLSLNYTKTCKLEPSEKWTFVGFTYNQGEIDISKATQMKFKRKIKRLSRRYYKLKTKKELSDKQTLSLFINKINHKMLGKNFDSNDLCWSRWFFPLINTSKSLKNIDKFIQDRLRYSVNGRYSKLNFKRTPYSILQKLNYQPLTKLFYLFKLDYEKFNKIVQNLNYSLQTYKQSN